MPELTPPENSPVITLEAPQPVAVVPQDEADQLVKLDLTKVPELDAKVNDFVMHVLQTPVNTSVFDEKVKAIHQLGSAKFALPRRLQIACSIVPPKAWIKPYLTTPRLPNP